jgi:hypothetical protein
VCGGGHPGHQANPDIDQEGTSHSETTDEVVGAVRDQDQVPE